MRIVYNGFLCVGAVVLALLATLVLAGAAHAAIAPGMQRAVSGLEVPSEATAETPVSPGEGAGEKAPEEVQAPAGETVPVPEEPAEPAPVVPVVEEPVEPAPVVPVVEEPVETAPVVPVLEAVAEAPPGKAGGGESAEASLSAASGTSGSASAPVALQDTLTHGEGEQEATSAPIVALTEPPTIGPTGPEILSSSGSAGALVGIAAAQRAGPFKCELSALGGRTTDNCTAGWMGNDRFPSASSAGFTVGSYLLAAATGESPGGGGHGGSAVWNPPVSPAPGPAPSGAGGGAGIGGSGLGLSGHLTLSGLLLLGAPRAMRRLRLSCQPWLTACFVLIPERPG